MAESDGRVVSDRKVFQFSMLRFQDTAGEVGFYAFSSGAEAPGYTAAPDESGLQAPLMGRCYVARSL